MSSILFSRYLGASHNEGPFERLLRLFQELLLYNSGDVAEALDWMNQLDREYDLTDDNYGMGDFIEDLKRRGYIKESGANGRFTISSKMEQVIRKSALEEIFGKLRRSGPGEHHTDFTGKGDESLPELKPYEFGDSTDRIALTESMRNAQMRWGIDDSFWVNDDLVVQESSSKMSTATVLMIDISHSMILYGEDRITPAKKVALALAEFIRSRYPKDTLDILVFGNDAWQISLKELPYLEVGPFHTNTVAGLQLAQDLLRKKRNHNKQIFMITDGKPSCLKELGGYYKNSFGLDRKIVNKTLNEAIKCRRNHIQVTTFMLATDPYLKQFIHEFTDSCKGKAFYSGLDKLGSFVIHDYTRNKRKNR
ncbi:MAG: VWA domain-containing protein [Flavobacteriales bacterium]|nr:VWA domain-containing protein [Flavobacteriales bacterium]